MRQGGQLDADVTEAIENIVEVVNSIGVEAEGSGKFAPKQDGRQQEKSRPESNSKHEKRIVTKRQNKDKPLAGKTNTTKRRKIGDNDLVWKAIQDVCESYQVQLATVLGERISLEDEEALEMLDKISGMVASEKGINKAFNVMFGDSSQRFLESLRIPDWASLYFKLEAKLPDQGWQTLINLSKLGRTKVRSF